MPEPKPAVPAAPAAPVPTKPAASAVPAKVAAAPKPSAPAHRPARANRPALSASTALKLDQKPAEAIADETKRMRENFRHTTTVVEPKVPAAPAAAAPAKSLPDLGLPEKEDDEPVAAAPAAPAVPAKIKVGDKEYTADELIAENKRLADEAKARIAAAPAAPAEEPAPAPVLTKEEIAQKEAAFMDALAPTLAAPLTENELDTILAGGKGAIEVMTRIRQKDMALAVMQARKGMAQVLDPIMTNVFNTLNPLAAAHQELQRYNIEQQFTSRHKDFTPHLPTARSVATELARKYPKEVAAMTHDQFIDEVARQTDVILTNEHKRWFPTGDGNWRASGVPAPAALVAPVAPAPAAPAAPVISPAPTAPAPRAARAPAANSPSGTPAGGTVPWQKSVAATLRG